MKKDNTIIFTGGEAPERALIELVMSSIFKNPFVIAADSGLITAQRYNLPVDILLGDMDSLGEVSSCNTKALITKVYPAHKDYTDTELALIEASSEQNTSLILIGGNGGRFDHLLAIRSLYERKSSIPYPDIWFCGSNMVLCLDQIKRKTLTIQDLKPDDYISLFPMYVYEEEPRLYSTGLLWDVSNLAWKKLGGSVSNKAQVHDSKTDDVKLTLEKGRFLVCIPLHSQSSVKVF